MQRSVPTKDYLFDRDISGLIVSKEQVTTIHPKWTLERALLVLTRKGLSSVPVINDEEQVEGVISKTHILDFMREQGNIDFAKLPDHTVEEAMDKNHQGIWENSIFSFAFEILINRSYIPIIDKQNRFVGILTRKVVMEEVMDYFREEFFAAKQEN
jgi:CBS domain-containing protein